MRIADIVGLSFKNVSRGKSRVSLSVLAVSVGIASLILLTQAGNAAKVFINEKLGGIGLDGLMVTSGDRSKLSAEDGHNIVENIGGIEDSMPFEFWFSYYSIGKSAKEPCLILGIDESVAEYTDIEVISGRELNYADCLSDNTVCLVDKRLGGIGRVGENITLEVDGTDFDFTVIGVCSSSMDSTSAMIGIDIPPFIYVPWSALCNSDDAVLGQLILKLSEDADSSIIAEKVRSYLSDVKHDGRSFGVEDMTEYRKQFKEIIDVVTFVLAGTASVSLFVAALGIMSSMLSNVNERKCEIGICKSIGATSAEICLLFLFESVIISCIGCIIGVFCGLCVLWTVFYVAFGILPDIDLYAVILPCLFSLSVGLISGVVPALKASKLSPVNAIKRE